MFPEEIVERFEKAVTCPKQTLGAVKVATGSGLTVTLIVSVPVQPLEEVTDNITL